MALMQQSLHPVAQFCASHGITKAQRRINSWTPKSLLTVPAHAGFFRGGRVSRGPTPSRQLYLAKWQMFQFACLSQQRFISTNKMRTR